MSFRKGDISKSAAKVGKFKNDASKLRRGVRLGLGGGGDVRVALGDGAVLCGKAESLSEEGD